MGSWGAALYADDAAGDLKNAIALVTKVPADSDRLLAILKQFHGDEAIDPADGDGAMFWLVVADQFERKGIACREAADTALHIIESGTDLAACAERGADDKFLQARRKVLLELESRLRAPRPTKPPRKAGKPPALVLETGQVFAFPTMDGRAWHPYRLPSAGEFVGDGWGALVVLATGRAFDWLPWVALAGLTVATDRKPAFDEALDGRLIPHPQTFGAARFVPKAAHAKGLGLELLGNVELDADKVLPHLSKWRVESAIQYDWTIAYGALTSRVLMHDSPPGAVLRSLCR